MDACFIICLIFRDDPAVAWPKQRFCLFLQFCQEPPSSTGYFSYFYAAMIDVLFWFKYETSNKLGLLYCFKIMSMHDQRQSIRIISLCKNNSFPLIELMKWSQVSKMASAVTNISHIFIWLGIPWSRCVGRLQFACSLSRTTDHRRPGGASPHCHGDNKAIDRRVPATRGSYTWTTSLLSSSHCITFATSDLYVLISCPFENPVLLH